MIQKPRTCPPKLRKERRWKRRLSSQKSSAPPVLNGSRKSKSRKTSIGKQRDNSTMPKLEGRCLCGQFSYASDAAPLATLICHCRNCQRQGGAAFSLNVVVPAASLATKGELRLTWTRDSGNTVERQFCATCGSPIFSMLRPTRTLPSSGRHADDTSGLNRCRKSGATARNRLPPMVAEARFPKNPA